MECLLTNRSHSLTIATLLAAGLLQACTPDYEGTREGECQDDIDNDEDGMMDCVDPDCAGASNCQEEEADSDADCDADTDSDTDADSDADADTDTDTDTGLDDRTIEFAGRQWWVKSGYGGPGPNSWSDSEESVWLDKEGRLNLKIRQIDGIWHCAEVYTVEPTQHGMHRFYIDGPLDELDENAVFAPFIYADDQTEVDIEFTRWGDAGATDNSQYVIQPYANAGNLETFSSQLKGSYTTHSFDWQPDWIQFKSIHGHYAEPPDDGYLIHQWLYEGQDNPQEEEELHIHINLWLYQGAVPASGEEVTVAVQAADLPAVAD